MPARRARRARRPYTRLRIDELLLELHFHELGNPDLLPEITATQREHLANLVESTEALGRFSALK